MSAVGSCDVAWRREQPEARGLVDYYSRAQRGAEPVGWRRVRRDWSVGDVDRDGFMRTMHGCDPRSGERRRPDTAIGNRAGRRSRSRSRRDVRGFG
jgi:hypothetical protein